MIVTYSGANLLYLPVQHYIKSGEKAGKLQDPKKVDQSKVQKFTPGNNEISSENWSLIQDGIAARDKLRPGVKDHYDNCFCVIGGKEQADGRVTGPDKINFLALHHQQATKVVKGTVEMKQLEVYLALEKGSDKPRNSVLKAIGAQIEEVKAFHTKIADDKDN